MMGMEIEGPTCVFGDNQSVLHNNTTPESTLKKKSHALACHFVRESVAMGETLTGCVNADDNVADIFTKVLPGGKRHGVPRHEGRR